MEDIRVKTFLSHLFSHPNKGNYTRKHLFKCVVTWRRHL